MAHFVVDESLPPQLAEALRAIGHDAIHVQDAGIAGADDDTVFALAVHEDAILLSQDMDFSDIRRFPADVSLVVVRFRHSLTRDELVRRCVGAVQRFAVQIELLHGEVMILEPGRGRIRDKIPEDNQKEK